MVLRLDLTAEAEARLRERAAADGKEVDRFVLDVVEEKLTGNGSGQSGPIAAPAREETAQEWIARFDDWVQSHPRRGYVADDSRESIYAGSV